MLLEEDTSQPFTAYLVTLVPEEFHQHLSTLSTNNTIITTISSDTNHTTNNIIAALFTTSIRLLPTVHLITALLTVSTACFDDHHFASSDSLSGTNDDSFLNDHPLIMISAFRVGT